jgi:cysteine-rich repeat protein
MIRSTLLLGSLTAALLSACDDGGGGTVTPQCGDGNVTAGEQCDDGNLTNGDGCSSTCQGEDLRICGDGSLAGNEECDDGNTTNGDGCSSTCQIEADPDCGNGAIDGSEGCDDGGNAPGDGCSATCTVESGYICTGAPSVCTEVANANGSCAAPFVVTLTNNGGVLEGTGSGSTNGSSNQMEAADCDGADSGDAKDHVWQFTLTQTSDVSLELLGTTEFDASIRVMTQACTLSSQVPEYRGADGCSDSVFAGSSEYLDYVALAAGTYYIVIDGYEVMDIGNYEFTVSARPTLCGNGLLDGDFEVCDDNNPTGGDGCDAHCEVEDGYVCTEAEPSVCTMDGGAVTTDLKINEFLANPGSNSDTNCDGTKSTSQDEFVELVNVGTAPIALAGLTISDDIQVRHTFPANTPALQPGKAFVVWGGGSPACPGVTNFQIASSNVLGFNNADSIIVKRSGTIVASVTYSGAASGISSNRSPDVTGTSFVAHDTISTSKFSPGKHADGSAF